MSRQLCRSRVRTGSKGNRKAEGMRPTLQLVDNPIFINESEICLRTDSEARIPKGSQGEGPVSQKDDARQGTLQWLLYLGL